jgi:hypothetical protein
LSPSWTVYSTHPDGGLGWQAGVDVGSTGVDVGSIGVDVGSTGVATGWAGK